MILWLKAFHIIFMVCWFAGIFYLPRIFVYYASAQELKTKKVLCIMATKLFWFITPFAVFTVIIGVALVSHNAKFYMLATWFKLKLLLVIALIFYHISCYYYLRKIQQENNNRSHVFFRFYNELPVFLLFGIVILVILKPFS